MDWGKDCYNTQTWVNMLITWIIISVFLSTGAFLGGFILNLMWICFQIGWGLIPSLVG